jgi:hypothetical protein
MEYSTIPSIPISPLIPPKTVDLHNFASCNRILRDNFLSFGPGGEELLLDKDLMINLPTLDDVYVDAENNPILQPAADSLSSVSSRNRTPVMVPILRYPADDHGRRSATVMEAFNAEFVRITAARKVILSSRTAFIKVIRDICSTTSLARLMNSAEYPAAYASSDQRVIYKLFVAAHTNAHSQQAFALFKEAVNLQMGSGGFEVFLSDLHAAEDRITDTLQSPEPAHKGYIKIEHLMGVLLMTGIDKSMFDYPINKILADSTSARLDDLHSVIIPYLQKHATRTAAALPTEPHAGFSAVPATSAGFPSISPSAPLKPAPLQEPTKCACGQRITGVSAKGFPHKFCPPCFAKRQRPNASTTKSVTPAVAHVAAPSVNGPPSPDLQAALFEAQRAYEEYLQQSNTQAGSQATPDTMARLGFPPAGHPAVPHDWRADS